MKKVRKKISSFFPDHRGCQRVKLFYSSHKLAYLKGLENDFDQPIYQNALSHHSVAGKCFYYQLFEGTKGALVTLAKVSKNGKFSSICVDLEIVGISIGFVV